jgi:hypothetical protein
MSVPAETQKQRKRKHWRWSAYASGAFLLVLVSLPGPEEQSRDSAYRAGEFMGTLLFPLAFALLVRLAYVKLIRRDGRPVWSPWVFAIALLVAAMARAGRHTSGT